MPICTTNAKTGKSIQKPWEKIENRGIRIRNDDLNATNTYWYVKENGKKS
jgi:hypothetical protein